MISSARIKNASEIVRPSAFAVYRVVPQTVDRLGFHLYPQHPGKRTRRASAGQPLVCQDVTDALYQ
jgi:hypothetical protein